jgi:hypothetical protein
VLWFAAEVVEGIRDRVTISTQNPGKPPLAQGLLPDLPLLDCPPTTLGGGIGMPNARFVPPRWAAVLVIAVLIFGLSGGALAQTDVTSTRISGTVKDADGGALPGVSTPVGSCRR